LKNSCPPVGRHEQQYPQVNTTETIACFRASRNALLTRFVEHDDGAPLMVTLPEPLTNWLAATPHIRALEKRFIIRQDLYVRSQPLIAQLTAPQLLWVAILLLEHLTAEYQQQQDLNSLNSALRLTDHLLQTSPIELLIQMPKLAVLVRTQLEILEHLLHEPIF
jgi:hypothetical protein